MIPNEISQTIDWLLRVEDFDVARALAWSVSKRMDQSDPQTYDFLASVLFRSKHYAEAAQIATRTSEMLPDSADAHFNLAKCLNSAGNPAEAERRARDCLRLRPDWLDPQIDLAVYVCAQGRQDEAMRMLLALETRIPADSPDRDVIRFNLGWHRIRHGDFRRGLADLSIGRKLKIWGAMTHRYPKPLLELGTDLRGKTLLVVGEGGAGDEMIAARFAQTVRARGGKTIWVPFKPLRSLFSRAPAIDRVIPVELLEACDYDYWAPCMDLPRLLGLEIHEIPNHPYLSPDPAYAEKWRAWIPQTGRLRVGLRWQGNALYEQDLMRSVPFAQMEALADIGQVDFYSLQRDEGSDERPADSSVVDLGKRLETWEDTAGAIANLDLVISSCTSIPHLAAAMGKPTWLLCPLNCYYIWATPGGRSPWYPSLRLFRQTRYGSWAEPLGELRLELERKLRGTIGGEA